HEILEQFYRRHSGAAWEELLDEVSIDVFRRFEKDNPDLYPIAWQAEQNKILAVLKRFIPLDLAEMKASGFKPAQFEMEMTVDKPVTLHGRVDRLDLREGKNPGFRVVDYKTGTGGIGKKD